MSGSSDLLEATDIWLSEVEEDKYEKYAWHFDMLHHSARHTAFVNAFRRLPMSKLAADGVGPVLDVGCGSGLLGLLLLKNCPDVKNLKVTAVEVDRLLAQVAVDNISRMGFSSNMEVHARRSTKLRFPHHSRSPLVISELFDSAVLGESVLPTLRHAAEHLLAPGYLSVPSRLRIYGKVVESSFLQGLQGLALDAPRLPFIPDDWRNDAGDARPHEVNHSRLVMGGHVRELTAEFAALTIDFENLPPREGQQVVFDVQCEASGMADAVVFWWKCAMFRGDAWDHSPRGLTNAPSAPGDPDHWRQAVCVLPSPVHGRHMERGEVLRVTASHDDDLVWFHVERSSHSPSVSPGISPPHCGSSNLGLLSPWRLRMINSAKLMQCLRQVAESCVARLRGLAGAGPPTVVDLSEGGFMALFCAARHCRVRSRGSASSLPRRLQKLVVASRRHRERSRGGHRRRVAALRVVALGPRSARRLGGELAAELSAVCGRWRRAARGGPKVVWRPLSWRPAPGSVRALLAEPYDGAVEERECDLRLWQHWAQVRDFKPALHADPFVWPRRFRLCVAAMACGPLWQRRQPLSGRDIEGVDVSHMDRLASDRHFPWVSSGGVAGVQGHAAGRGRLRFPCELWQQEHVVHGHPGMTAAVLCELDVLQQQLGPITFDACRIELPETCESVRRFGVHALATWSELHLGLGEESGTGERWYSSAGFASDEGVERFAPGAFKQGVLLAEHPRFGDEERVEGSSHRRKRRRQETTSSWIEVQASFDPARGELRLTARWENGHSF